MQVDNFFETGIRGYILEAIKRSKIATIEQSIDCPGETMEKKALQLAILQGQVDIFNYFFEVFSSKTVMRVFLEGDQKSV